MISWIERSDKTFPDRYISLNHIKLKGPFIHAHTHSGTHTCVCVRQRKFFGTPSKVTIHFRMEQNDVKHL